MFKLDTPDNFHEWFKLNCVSHSYNTRSNFIDINNIVKSNNIFILGALISFVKCLKNYLLQKYT